MNRESISAHLLGLYEGPNERCGFILKDGSIVEVPNVAPDPTMAFLVSGEDVLKHCDDAAGTWHTHPSANANLSVGDYETFLQWNDLTHFIVGTDGVRSYDVKNGRVMCADASISTAS